MTSRVTQANEVYLNTTRFQLAGQVTSSLISEYPEKLITGDYGRDSHKNISVQTWNNQRGGMGVHRMQIGQDDRCEFSQLDLRHQGHLTHWATVNVTTGVPDAIPLISELDGVIVAAFDTDIRDLSNLDWTTSRHTLAATPTDVRNGNVGGTEYLVFCYTTGYAYSSAIATWATSTKDALNIEFWDGKLWGIDATGQLWYTLTMGSGEINDAQLLLENAEVVTGLLRGRAADGEFILYAVTSKRLLAHDFQNRRFVQVEGIMLPDNNLTTHERSAITWRERIYLAAGRGLIEYDPVGRTIRPVGFDLDDGMPAGYDVKINCLAASVTELFAGCGPVSSNDVNLVMAWDGHGWAMHDLSGISSTTPIQSMHVTTRANAQSLPGYRLYWGYEITDTYRVVSRVIPDGYGRLTNIDGFDFGSVIMAHHYPVFDAGQSDITKVALRLKMEVEGADATQEVQVYIDFDGTGTFTLLDDTYTNDSSFNATDDAIEAAGVTTFHFPSVANPSGTEFRTAQIRFTSVPGGTDPPTDVISATLEYFKVLDPKWGFAFDLDLNGSYSDQSSAQQRAALVTAAELATLVEFTFRDDTGNTRNYYVNVRQVTGMEETGHNERGIVHVRLEEP